MPKADMAQSQALHKWWEAVMRRNKGAIPTPADSFIAGFAAARSIYMKHAEEAMDELSRLKFPDTTGQ